MKEAMSFAQCYPPTEAPAHGCMVALDVRLQEMERGGARHCLSMIRIVERPRPTIYIERAAR